MGVAPLVVTMCLQTFQSSQSSYNDSLFLSNYELQLIPQVLLTMSEKFPKNQNQSEERGKIPKIKKSQYLSKLLIDPADIQKGLPQSSLPQMTDKCIILSLTPQKVPLAKLSPEGTLKINMKYNAQTTDIINRYVQVTVIDDYDDFWVGNLFGFTVKGTGGSGTVRGCKVLRIEGQTIIVEGFQPGKNQQWKKYQNRVQQILSRNQ